MYRPDWEDGVERSWWPARRVEDAFSLPSPWAVALGEFRRFLRAAFLRRTRRQLMELTDDQLEDIGVTREAAQREARRSLHLD